MTSANAAPENVRGPVRRRFPKSAKLLKHSDFQCVYKSGKRHFSGLLTAFYMPRAGEGETGEIGPRVGITVSRAMGGAVERNRIKRRMREAVRFRLSELTASVDVVFNPKRVVLNADFGEIEREVGRAFEAIGKAAAKMFRERSGKEA
jgi:ribonuclease P protein component